MNLKQQVVYGFIQKMKQLILMQILLMMIILNLSNIRLNYYETDAQPAPNAATGIRSKMLLLIDLKLNDIIY